MYAIYATAMRVKEDQRARRVGPHQIVEILHLLSDDFGRAWLPADDEAGAFVLEEPAVGGAMPMVSFTTLVPDPHDPDLRWADAVAVRYQTSRAGSGYELLRVSQPLAGPGAAQEPVTNRLARVEAFAVEVFDGTDWQRAYRSEDTESLPSAVRLTLALGDARSGSPAMVTEVLIPSGLKISGSLQRTGGAGP